MEGEIIKSPTAQKSRLKRYLIIGSAAFALFCVAIGVVIFHASQPQSLLPVALARRTTNFVPYFYFGKIPAGYAVDSTNSRSSGGTLLVSLVKPDEPTLVLSEQPLPNNLSHDQIFQNGEKIEGVDGTATINDVEGRLVGAYTPLDHNLLILLNAPGIADKGDIKALLSGLRPTRNP